MELFRAYDPRLFREGRRLATAVLHRLRLPSGCGRGFEPHLLQMRFD